MEVVRKYVDASSLIPFMTLPQTFHNRKLEIIVMPAEEPVEETKKTGSISKAVQSLIGAIPNNDMSLEDYRKERLAKYEIAD